MNKCKRLVMILAASIAASLAMCGQFAFAIPPTNTLVDDGGGGGGDGISTAEITKEHIVRNSYYRILHNCFTGSLRSPISFVGVTFPDADRGDEQVFNDDSTAHKEFPTGFIDDAVYCAGSKPGVFTDARDGILTQIKPYVKNSTPLSIVSPNLVEPNVRESYYTNFGYVGSYSGSGGSNDDGDAPANPASEAYCLSISFQTDQVSGKSSDLCMTLDDNKVITGMYQEGTSQVTNRSGQPIDTFQISLNGVYNGTEYNSDFYYNAFANCGKPYMCIAVVFLNKTGDEYYPQEYYGTDLVPYLDTTNGDANYDALLLNLNSYINSGLVSPPGSSEFYRPASLNMVYDLRKVEVGESGGEGDEGQDPTLVMNDTYTNNDGEAGYNKLYGLIQGDGLQKDMAAFDDTELFYIYTDYLSRIYGAKIGFNTCSDNDDSSGTVMYVPTVVRNENNVKKMKYCIIDNWSSIQYQGKHKIRINSNMQTKNSSTEDLIALLKGVAGSATVSRLPANQSTASDLGDPVIPEETDPTDPSEEAETEPSCASRAGELGWILCPLIKGAGDLLQGFFESWIEPFLQIDAELLGGSGNGVFEAWQGFQGIANLAFIAIFLFVIFSQLTGIGIDNYGIKKVLPKLIIGAILINLSYIICQLAVDISNIVGHAMKGFFGSLPPNVGGVQIRVNGGEGTGALEAGAFVLTAIVGALVVQKVLTMGIMVIIPILIMVLTLVFALFFLFFMLGLRQALAIVLVTISPLAFVCYILPNTKSLFKRWTDLFKAMLLAYPIASALVYGGDLVSRILINANAAAGTPGVVESLGLLVTAAIVSIAPVFAIPSLLQKSLSAVNGVGNMLGRVQAGGRNGANRVGTGLQNSRVGNHMQNWQDSRNKIREENRNLRRAGLQRNADGSIELSRRGRAQDRRAQRLGNSNGGRAYRQRLAAARNEAYSSYNSDMSAARIATDAGAMATLAGLTNKQQQQEINDEIVNMAKDTGNYDIDTMQSKLQSLMSRDSLSAEDTVRAHALASKLSETGFGAKGLAKIFSSSKTTSAARQEMANYITSTEVASKLGSKDMYVAQYMRDVVANPGKYGNMSFDDWALDSSSHTYKDENGVEHAVSNVEHVAKNILDDDELLAKQSTGSLQRTMDIDQQHSSGTAGSGIYIDSEGNERMITVGITDKASVSGNRAQKIIDNGNIHTKEEQDTLLGRRARNEQVRKINKPA